MTQRSIQDHKPPQTRLFDVAPQRRLGVVSALCLLMMSPLETQALSFAEDLCEELEERNLVDVHELPIGERATTVTVDELLFERMASSLELALILDRRFEGDIDRFNSALRECREWKDSPLPIVPLKSVVPVASHPGARLVRPTDYNFSIFNVKEMLERANQSPLFPKAGRGLHKDPSLRDALDTSLASLDERDDLVGVTIGRFALMDEDSSWIIDVQQAVLQWSEEDHMLVVTLPMVPSEGDVSNHFLGYSVSERQLVVFDRKALSGLWGGQEPENEPAKRIRLQLRLEKAHPKFLQFLESLNDENETKPH